MLKKSKAQEFFDGEQHDLVVSILTKALRDCDSANRDFELLSDILNENPIVGNGKGTLEKIKKIFSTTDGLKENDFSKLKEIGFEFISDQNHYKIRYKNNEKYQFTIYKTPSDYRGGKNMASDIIKKISVYKFLTKK